MRATPYIQGYREASKKAVELLHEQAADMNNPKARDILNSAAFHLGVVLKRGCPVDAKLSPVKKP